MSTLNRTITIRLDAQLSADLAHLTESHSATPSWLIRQALREAIPQWKRRGISLTPRPRRRPSQMPSVSGN